MNVISAITVKNKILFIAINVKYAIKGNKKIFNFATNAINACRNLFSTINLNVINAVVIDSKTETFSTAKTVIYVYKNKKFKKMNLVINVNNAKIFTYVVAN